MTRQFLRDDVARDLDEQVAAIAWLLEQP